MKTTQLKLTPVMAALLLVVAGPTWADSGTFNMKISKAEPIPVGDRDGHVIYMGEANGTAEGGWKDGSKVLNREYVDIVNGNGTHQGYITAIRGGDKEVTKWSGEVTTTMNEDGTPNTTFGGTWLTVHAIGGFEENLGDRGVYEGYFTSPTDYVLEWTDELE